jgi:uncharacterized protein DUF3592
MTTSQSRRLPRPKRASRSGRKQAGLSRPGRKQARPGRKQTRPRGQTQRRERRKQELDRLPAAVPRIALHDYRAFLCLLLPLVMALLWLLADLGVLGAIRGRRMSGFPFALVALPAVTLWPALAWRVSRLRRLFAEGGLTRGTVTTVQRWKDRVRLTLSYRLDGEDRVATHTVMRSPRSRAVRVGDDVIVAFDPRRPGHAFVRDLFTADKTPSERAQVKLIGAAICLLLLAAPARALASVKPAPDRSPTASVKYLLSGRGWRRVPAERLPESAAGRAALKRLLLNEVFGENETRRTRATEVLLALDAEPQLVERLHLALLSGEKTQVSRALKVLQSTQVKPSVEVLDALVVLLGEKEWEREVLRPLRKLGRRAAPRAKEITQTALASPFLRRRIVQIVTAMGPEGLERTRETLRQEGDALSPYVRRTLLRD